METKKDMITALLTLPFYNNTKHNWNKRLRAEINKAYSEAIELGLINPNSSAQSILDNVKLSKEDQAEVNLSKCARRQK